MRSRVELFEQIRRDRRLEQLSIRELAERHGVHRRSVRQALESAVAPLRKEYALRPRPALDAWVPMIDTWLLADREAPRKQRHTARRVWQRLVAEHGASLAEVTVSRYVAQRRRELGLDEVEVAIPQTHLPGAEAEVDFGEFHFDLAGVDVTCWMFVMRLSHSGRAFHMAFGSSVVCRGGYEDPPLDLGAVGWVHRRFSFARSRCCLNRRCGRRPVEFVEKGHIARITTAGGNDEGGRERPGPRQGPQPPRRRLQSGQLDAARSIVVLGINVRSVRPATSAGLGGRPPRRKQHELAGGWSPAWAAERPPA